MTKPAAPPTFPYWPFSCMAFYSHVARDLSGCAEAVTQAEDGVQAMKAEADYGVTLFHDLMQGYYDLALMPFTAMTGILTAKATHEQTPPDKAAQA
jgi:hypothetical protein